MREIKFRAWDERRGHWVIPTIHHSGYNLNELLNSIEDDGLQLVRYTGLKDKNGVEIYEGDVVKETIRSYMGESEQERFWPITWGDEFAGFNVGEAPHWSVLNPVDIKRMEVAGNIYEHGHLLENESKE